MIRKIKICAAVLLFIFTVFLILWGLVSSSAYVGRWFNWKFGYERLVEQKIKAMVIPEALNRRPS